MNQSVCVHKEVRQRGMDNHASGINARARRCGRMFSNYPQRDIFSHDIWRASMFFKRL